MAITRAQRNLYICRANRRERFGKTEYMMESRFIDEMDPYLLETKTYDYANNKRLEHSDFSKPKKSEKFPAFGVNAMDFLQSRKSAGVKADAQKDALQVGDRIRHKFFGEGTIKSIGESGADDIVITFDQKGEKILSKSAAPIKKL